MTRPRHRAADPALPMQTTRPSHPRALRAAATAANRHPAAAPANRHPVPAPANRHPAATAAGATGVPAAAVAFPVREVFA